ncbi:MAG TPA: LamG domain-containing protein, partial [bacterium]|nr:LamG domain-containing protein [bacterium]
YDGNLKWTCTGQLDKTPDVKYRRVWSMAVYRGSLFCGTLPSGHVYRLETGKCISHDDELKSGWRHLIAIRDNGILKVFVDREQVAQSAQFSSNGFDLGNEQPLRIGFGPHDYFNGIIRNVRLYGRVLTGEEIATLSHEAAPNG